MATPLAYAIDMLALDVYVNRSSLADQNVPTKSRPWLMLCMEPISRRVLASCLSEYHPDRESIKAFLSEAFFADDEDKQSASLPDEIWLDAGIALGFSSLQYFLQELHITPRLVPRSARGPIERFFLQVQQVCIPSCSPGEDGSGNRFIAESTLPELEERFAQFLQQYHHQVHASTGQTPLESWQEQSRPSPLDPQVLSQLFHDGDRRRVVKDGIHFRTNVYWHADLAPYTGKEVHIRMNSTQTCPETIEVFFEQQWICSASLQEEANNDPLPHENGGM